MGYFEDLAGYINPQTSGGPGVGQTGSYWDKMVDYGMNMGGSLFGITPAQTAAYNARKEQQNTLDFINRNTIVDSPYGPTQPQFDPSKKMELAVRTGTVGQYLAGEAAMDRQKQEQIWSSENMTLAQKTAETARQQQLQWEMSRWATERTTLSAAQQAQNDIARQQVGISGGHLALAQQEFNLKKNQAAAVAAYPALGLTGQPAMDYRNSLGKMDRAAQIGTDVAQYLNTVPAGGKALDRGTVNAMQSAYEQHVVPALATMVGTGTIQQGDMDFIKSVIGNPGAWASLDANQRQKVTQVLTSINDERARLYGLGGMRPPEVRPGSSAWARSRGSIEPPRDVTFQTIGGP